MIEKNVIFTKIFQDKIKKFFDCYKNSNKSNLIKKTESSYTTASFIQKFSYFLMRRVTSDKIKLLILRKFYRI